MRESKRQPRTGGAGTRAPIVTAGRKRQILVLCAGECGGGVRAGVVLQHGEKVERRHESKFPVVGRSKRVGLWWSECLKDAAEP